MGQDNPLKSWAPTPRRVESENPDIVAVVDAMAEMMDAIGRTVPLSLGTPTAVKFEDYQARVGELVLVDPTDRSLTIYLPDISASEIGALVTIKNHSASTNTITLQPRGDAFIDGVPIQVMAAARMCVPLVAISTTNWIVASYI